MSGRSLLAVAGVSSVSAISLMVVMSYTARTSPPPQLVSLPGMAGIHSLPEMTRI